MIIIKETTQGKLPGKSSLFINFPYNETIIDKIKTVPNAVWHKKIATWEIPMSSLNIALDTLTLQDEIQLTFMSDSDTETSLSTLSTSEIQKFKCQPFAHQIEGINYGLTHNKWLLLDNPGCGKTNQIIWLAETLKNRGEIDHCLIIAGINSLKSNWKKEIKTFSNESSIIIGEKIKKDGTISKTPMSISERLDQLAKPIKEFFVIINVESLRNESIIKQIQKGPNKFGMIAIDEVHKCLATGRSSTQGNNILKLDAKYKVAATGTLILNNPINCWGPLKWTENDNSTLTAFKSTFCNFGGFNNSQIIGYKNLELLKDTLDNCSLRRSKEDLVDLPPKTVTIELLDMDDAHKKFYEAIKQGVKEEANKINLNASNLLALTTRLRQATVCPRILTTNDIKSTKIERCVEKVEELVELGEKVVILSTFKEPVYQLGEILAKYNPLICTGDQSDLEVSTNVDLFQQDDEHMVIIGSLAKMSTGLTLNRASYLIMLDEHYTQAMNDQAQNRIFRISNTRPAFITILACKDTIDERVHAIAQYKKDLSDFIIDDVNNELAQSLKDELADIITNL